MAAVPPRLTTRDGQSLPCQSHGGLEIMRRLVRLVARSSHSPAIAGGECSSELARASMAARGCGAWRVLSRRTRRRRPHAQPLLPRLGEGGPQTVLEPKQSNNK
jgi:hypothetical protein